MWPFMLGTFGLNMFQQLLNRGEATRAEERSETLGREAIDTHLSGMPSNAVTDQSLANIQGGLNNMPTYGGAPNLQDYYEGQLQGLQPITPAVGAYGALQDATLNRQDELMGFIDDASGQGSQNAQSIYNRVMGDVSGFFDQDHIDRLQGSSPDYQDLNSFLPDVRTSFEDQERSALDQIGQRQRDTEQQSLRDAMQYRGNMSPEDMARMAQTQARQRGDVIASAAPGVRAQYDQASREMEMNLRNQNQALMQFTEGQRGQNERLAAQLTGSQQAQQAGAAQALGGQQMGIQSGFDMNRMNVGANAQQGFMDRMVGITNSQQAQELAQRLQGTQEAQVGANMGQQDFANQFALDQQRQQDFWNAMQTNMGLYNQNYAGQLAMQQQAAGILSGLPSIMGQWDFSPTYQAALSQMYPSYDTGGGGISAGLNLGPVSVGGTF